MRRLMLWIAAVAAMGVWAELLEGRPDIDTAIFLDVRGIGAGGQCRAEAEEWQAKAARNLKRTHVDYGFVNENQIAAAEIRDGKLVVGEMSYSTIVLPTWRGMLPEASEKLVRFKKAGGRVIMGTKIWAMRQTAWINGPGHEDIHVTKRILPDGRWRMFLVNEAREPRTVSIAQVGSKRFEPGERLVFTQGDPELFCSEAEKGGRFLTKEELLRHKPFEGEYAKLWSKELNDEIDARIEKFRKQDYLMRGFRPGETVEVVQVTSEFQVGCNMFNFGQLGKPEWDAQYRATWEKGGIFNAATVPFYWANFEHERGKPRYVSTEEDDPAYWAKFRKDRDYRPVCHWTKECPWAWRRPAPDRLLAFCKTNGVSVHGHCIIYPAWDPDWLKPIGLNDREAMWPFYEKRIREIAAYYKDAIPQWDIVNESWNRESGLVYPDDDVCVHNGLWDRLVPVPSDYTFKSFKVAEEVFPKNVKLVFNDAAQDGYFAFSKSLSKRGAKIDVSGFQMHIFSPLHAYQMMCGIPGTPNGMDWNPQHQLETFRKLDQLGHPIHLSEVTIPAPRGLLPDAEADEAQARMIRDNFRLWFSWPSVYRITYWNLVDGTGAEILASGMYNKDLTKKPSYWAIDRLVNHEWKTRLRVVADRDGRVRFRGFKGEYEVRREGP